ncbi:hypothetical protein IMSHALPRED_010769 [Imshaugia aleurites]|uniref:Uncharacterized protein n=1 Tax=Imshaugia aleurites TaxID=172621 RepID=A0A8H3IWE0_9LECA|nr:hypothetical protein IMSHALPRED_010769 [Imshaugia aleurites]
MLHLSNDMIWSNTLPAGQTVTRLTIIIGINNLCQTLLSLLLPQFSSLKDLTLKSVSADRRPRFVNVSRALTTLGLRKSVSTIENLDCFVQSLAVFPTTTVSMEQEGRLGSCNLSEVADLPNFPATRLNGEQNCDGENGQMMFSEDESSQDGDAVGSDDPIYIWQHRLLAAGYR